MVEEEQAIEDSGNYKAELASSVEINNALIKTLDHLNLNRLPASSAAGSAFKPPAVVAWLIGTWKGKGKGIFPTIKDFEYMEECSFEWDEKNPRPLLFYRQKTFSTKGNPAKPMHSESGYVRVIAPAGSTVIRTEFVLTAPNGVTTIEEGIIEGHTIKIKLVSTSRSSTARPPYTVGLERTYVVDPTANPPTLHYVVDMATTKTPMLTRHLEALLIKWSDETSDEEDVTA